MADTLTRYLKLKIAEDLSADAKYNLQRIDALGGTFITDSTETLQVRSRGDIVIEAESLDIGGSGSNGTISLGTASSKATVEGYTTDFNLRSALSLLSPADDANKVVLSVGTTQSGSSSISLASTGNATLTVPAGTGEVTTDVATQTLTNKSIDATTNTLSNISNASIASSAAIAYSKLALTSSIVNADLVAGIDASKIGDGSVSNAEFQTLDGMITAGGVTIQSQLNNKQGTVTGAASTITLLNLPQNKVLISDSFGKVTAAFTNSTQLGYLVGVTSSIQPQLDGKQATITGAATSVTSTDLAASKALVSDASGKIAASAVTSTELGYLTGASSPIQTQLNSKAGAGANSDITSLSGLTTPLSTGQGGTGNDGSDTATALLPLLPPVASKGLSVLRVNVTEDGIEWAAGAGTGTVNNVSVNAPLTISGDSTVSPTIGIPAATSSVNGYLTSSDWGTFNGKQDAITGAASTITTSNLTASRALTSDASGKVAVSTVTSTELDYLAGVSSSIQTQLGGKEPTITAGTEAQYWRGDKSWQTLNTAAVAESLTALYFTDARAKTAAVVNSTAGNETDQAPSVSAMKAYVSTAAGGALSYTWATADGTTKSITHSLNKVTISVTVYDENGEDILVDTIDRTSNNAVSLTSSVAPTGNWTVVIRP